MNTPLAGSGAWEPPEPATLPLAAALPPLPASPRVLVLIDGDCVSYGLVRGTARERSSRALRACDEEVLDFLDRVHAIAKSVDPDFRARCAVSTATAHEHRNILTSARNNWLTIRHGLDGADLALIEELDHLIEHSAPARPGRKAPARLTDLVILVGQDGIYAPPVRDLHLHGIPTWLIAPGNPIARKLRRAASAVTILGRSRPSIGPGRAA
jgi:hypothetical protein